MNQVGVRRSKNRFPLLGFIIWTTAFAGILYMSYTNMSNLQEFTFRSYVENTNTNEMITRRFERLEAKISQSKIESEKLANILTDITKVLKNLEITVTKATTSTEIFELISSVSKTNSEKIEKALDEFNRRADSQKCQKLLMKLVE